MLSLNEKLNKIQLLSDLSCIAYILFANINLRAYERKNYATLEFNPEGFEKRGRGGLHHFARLARPSVRRVPVTVYS